MNTMIFAFGVSNVLFYICLVKGVPVPVTTVTDGGVSSPTVTPGHEAREDDTVPDVSDPLMGQMDEYELRTYRNQCPQVDLSFCFMVELFLPCNLEDREPGYFRSPLGHGMCRTCMKCKEKPDDEDNSRAPKDQQDLDEEDNEDQSNMEVKQSPSQSNDPSTTVPTADTTHVNNQSTAESVSNVSTTSNISARTATGTSVNDKLATDKSTTTEQTTTANPSPTATSSNNLPTTPKPHKPQAHQNTDLGSLDFTKLNFPKFPSGGMKWIGGGPQWVGEPMSSLGVSDLDEMDMNRSDTDNNEDTRNDEEEPTPPFDGDCPALDCMMVELALNCELQDMVPNMMTMQVNKRTIVCPGCRKCRE